LRRVELRDPRHVLVPRLARIHVDVSLDPAGQNDAARKSVTKSGRQREPVLFVD
jgi:hypothetical protein